jgi:rhodanese-related sulfurtransferase
MKNANNACTPKPLSARELSSWLQSDQRPCVLDVREQQELAIAPFPQPVLHLPLSEAERWMSDLPSLLADADELVVLCHAGVRSWQFGCWLLSQDPRRSVWNLQGGIDAWSLNVDPGVPRY